MSPNTLAADVATWLGSQPELTFSAAQLRGFLDSSETHSESETERLRYLAIAAEDLGLPEGWEALRRVYEEAHRLDREDPVLLESWGIAASSWMSEWKTPSLADRQEIVVEAERVLSKSLLLEPDNPHAAYSMGHLFYGHPENEVGETRFVQKALGWFQRAICPENPMPQLYAAHCLHDLKRWDEAIAAYEAVDLDSLRRDWPAWRAVKAQEQLASCLAFRGDLEAATAAFTAFFDQLESWEDDLLVESVINLDDVGEALAEPLADEGLSARLEALTTRIEKAHLAGYS